MGLVHTTWQGNKSHAGTVVPECYKDDVESQWRKLKFDPPLSQNAWTDGYHNWHGWLRSDSKILPPT